MVRFFPCYREETAPCRPTWARLRNPGFSATSGALTYLITTPRPKNSNDPTSIHDHGLTSSIATPTLSTPPQLLSPCSSSALPLPLQGERPPAPLRNAPLPRPLSAVGLARSCSHEVPLTRMQAMPAAKPRKPRRATLRKKKMATQPALPVFSRDSRSLRVCCAHNRR